MHFSKTKALVVALLLGAGNAGAANTQAANTASYPWSEDKVCKLSNYKYTGLHPVLRKALDDLRLLHRVTNALNPSPKRSNYHNVDEVIDGIEVTSAVDISVRCLNDTQIKELLSLLAQNDIVGWLRRDGIDGWKGVQHIHAVWVGGKLKPQLKMQVHSWLEGRNGLKSNRHYDFWTPSEEEKSLIKTKFSDGAS